MYMYTISEVYLAVKGGADLENVIPSGADITLWQRLLNAYNPNAKPKRKPARRTTTRNSKRSSKARMDSVVGWATLELVGRVNGRGDIPFDGRPVPGDNDDYGLMPEA